MVRNYRKPLVIASPKVMLRHPSCSSSLSDMAHGTTFHPVLSDASVDPSQVTKVIFVSGKHYYTLAKERDAKGVRNIALIRVEVGRSSTRRTLMHPFLYSMLGEM